MDVRPLERSEWAAANRILHDVYLGEGYIDPEHVVVDVAAKAAAGTWLGAFADGELTGVVLVVMHGSAEAVVCDPGGAEIRLLAVDPRRRAGGAGAALMAEAEALACRSGAVAMTLSTQEAMRAAHRLYERLGYRRRPADDYVAGGRPFIVYTRVFDTT